MERHPSLPRLNLVFAAAGALLLAGCSSPGHRRDRYGNDQALAVRPVVAMRGQGLFFDGKIKAELTVSRGRAMPFEEGEGGGGGGGGGGGHYGGGHHGGRHQEDADTESDGGDDDSDSPARPIRSMNGSALAVTLRLKLVNVSKDAFDVDIVNVNSDLGDFAVQPERLLLAPDQSAQVDPMVSELGVTSDEIPVTVGLHIAGKTEQHVIVVKNVLRPPAEN